MGFVKKNIYYFARPGPENTADTVVFAIERAKELGIRRLVVASASGETALAFLGPAKTAGLELVVVTHVVGFTSPGVWEFRQDAKQALEAAGAA